jgi:hypothetical protein
MPIRPTLRSSTPIYRNNQLAGIVIINLEAEKMIEQLVHAADFLTWVIDQEGEVIHHPDHERSWSRYLKDRNSIQQLRPELTRSLLSNNNEKNDDFFHYNLDQIMNMVRV